MLVSNRPVISNCVQCALAFPAALLHSGHRHERGDAGDVHAAVHTCHHGAAGRAAGPRSWLAAEVCRHPAGRGGLSLHGGQSMLAERLCCKGPCVVKSSSEWEVCQAVACIAGAGRCDEERRQGQRWRQPHAAGLPVSCRQHCQHGRHTSTADFPAVRIPCIQRHVAVPVCCHLDSVYVSSSSTRRHCTIFWRSTWWASTTRCALQHGHTSLQLP